jgi:hypothetical protein
MRFSFSTMQIFMDFGLGSAYTGNRQPMSPIGARRFLLKYIKATGTADFKPPVALGEVVEADLFHPAWQPGREREASTISKVLPLRRSAALALQTGDDLIDFIGIANDRDDGHPAAALRAAQDIDLVDLGQKARPGFAAGPGRHGHLSDGGCFRSTKSSTTRMRHSSEIVASSISRSRQREGPTRVERRFYQARKLKLTLLETTF